MRVKRRVSPNTVEETTPENPLVTRLRKRVEAYKQAVEADYRFLGLSDDAVESRCSILDREFQKYQKAFELASQGLDKTEVAGRIGTPPGTLRGWLSGKYVPYGITQLDPKSREERKNPVEIPLQESTAFAYLLGAHAGVTLHAQYNPRLDFSHTNEAVMRKLEKAIRDSVGLDVDVKKGRRKGGSEPYFELKAINYKLAAHVNEVKRGNTRVPWEHLITRAERIAFLQGFVDFTGGVSQCNTQTKEGYNYHPRLHFQKLNNEDLIKDLAVLFKSVGILPTFKLGRRATLYVFDQNDLKKFRDDVGFTDEGMRQDFDRLYSLGYTRREATVEEYQDVMDYVRANPDDDLRAVARATGESYENVREWVRRGRRPRCMRRLEAVEALEAGLPDHEVIGHLARSWGVSGDLARIIARHKDMEELKENIGVMQDAGENPREKPYLLIESPETIRQKLSEERPEPSAAAEPGEKEPPYAGYVDRLTEKWFKKSEPERTADSLIRRLAKKYGRPPEDMQEYVLARMKEKDPKVHDYYQEYLGVRQEVEEERTLRSFLKAEVDEEAIRPPYHQQMEQLIDGWYQLQNPYDVADTLVTEAARQTRQKDDDVRDQLLKQMRKTDVDIYLAYIDHLDS